MQECDVHLCTAFVSQYFTVREYVITRVKGTYRTDKGQIVNPQDVSTFNCCIHSCFASRPFTKYHYFFLKSDSKTLTLNRNWYYLTCTTKTEYSTIATNTAKLPAAVEALSAFGLSIVFLIMSFHDLSTWANKRASFGSCLKNNEI